MLIAALVAALSLHSLLVVNAGDDAIFTLRVGHVVQAQWGDDVLGFADVIDVSKGRVVRVPFDPVTCFYDLRATYRNGTVVVIRDVNLCTADRVDFRN